jgi:hypothetical protein
LFFAVRSIEREEVKYIYYITIVLILTGGLSASVFAQKPGGNGIKGLHRVSTSNVSSATRIRRIQDGTSNTIMVGVRRRGRWTAPSTDVGPMTF